MCQCVPILALLFFSQEFSVFILRVYYNFISTVDVAYLIPVGFRIFSVAEPQPVEPKAICGTECIFFVQKCLF